MELHQLQDLLSKSGCNSDDLVRDVAIVQLDRSLLELLRKNDDESCGIALIIMLDPDFSLRSLLCNGSLVEIFTSQCNLLLTDNIELAKKIITTFYVRGYTLPFTERVKNDYSVVVAAVSTNPKINYRLISDDLKSDVDLYVLACTFHRKFGKVFTPLCYEEDFLIKIISYNSDVIMKIPEELFEDVIFCERVFEVCKLILWYAPLEILKYDFIKNVIREEPLNYELLIYETEFTHSIFEDVEFTMEICEKWPSLYLNLQPNMQENLNSKGFKYVECCDINNKCRLCMMVDYRSTSVKSLGGYGWKRGLLYPCPDVKLTSEEKQEDFKNRLLYYTQPENAVVFNLICSFLTFDIESEKMLASIGGSVYMDFQNLLDYRTFIETRSITRRKLKKGMK